MNRFLNNLHYWVTALILLAAITGGVLIIHDRAKCENVGGTPVTTHWQTICFGPDGRLIKP